MRLAVLTPSLLVGGAELAAVRMANGLAGLGHSVDLVSATDAVELADEIRDSVRLIRLGSRRTSLALARLAAYLKTHSPDVLVSHQGRANRVAIVAAGLAHPAIPVIVVEHNTISWDKYRWPAGPPRALMMALTARLYSAAAAVVHVSRCAAVDLEDQLGLTRGSVHVVHNPVPRPESDPGARERGRPGSPSRTPKRLIFVGRLVAQKDVPTLLRGFAAAAKNLSLELQVVGRGPAEVELRRLARELGLDDSVRFLGWRKDRLELMASADALVLSSRFEALPTVLIEALQLGCPVVSTDCPCGPREILDDGRLGVLVPVGNPAALAEGIEELLSGTWPPEVLRASTERYLPENTVRGIEAACARVAASGTVERSVEGGSRGGHS